MQFMKEKGGCSGNSICDLLDESILVLFVKYDFARKTL